MPDTDYAALAAQFGGSAASSAPASSGPAASSGPDYAALASQFGGTSEPDFKSSNETDASGAPVVRKYGRAAAYSTAADKFMGALKELHSVNPAEFLRFVNSVIVDPIKSIQQAAEGTPIGKTAIGEDARAFYQSRKSLSDAALEAFKRGDYLTGAAKGLEWLVPIVGDRLSQAGDLLQAGETAKGLAASADAVLPFVLPEAGKFMPKRIGPAPRAAGSMLNAAEEASNAFADANGIPLDAASATGSRTARAVQKRVANSMGGEGTASELIAAQREGLTRVGQDLAKQAAPGLGSATSETAGEGVRAAMQDTIRAMKARADAKYGEARALESAPEHLERVHSAPQGSGAEARILGELANGTEGVHPPTAGELRALRAIARELEEQPYSKGGWIDDAETGDTRGGHYAAGGGAGTPIYQAVFDAAGKAQARGELTGATNMTRRAMKEGILSTLKSGEWTTAAKMAYRLVQEKGAGAWEGSPYVDLSEPLVGDVQTIGFPVDVTPVQKAIRPIYTRLLRESQLSPLLGAKARALNVLDQFVNGPAQVSLSTAEGVLSDLKGMARGADMPELRDVGQGTAAYAVKHLSDAIQASAEVRGPEVLNAIEEGRSATSVKYQVKDLLKQIQDEPVRAFNQLTARNDTGIKLLRKVNEIAPQQMPVIARAWIENQLDLAMREGGFGHSDRLWSEWGRLGKETKRLLFPAPGQAQALDNFFLLSKRLAENPNPSGTAHTMTVLNVTGQPVAYGLAKLLYTKRGVDALTRVLKLEIPSIPGPNPAAVTAGARTAAYASLAEAAKAAGVSLPAAAGASPDGSGPRQQ